ncbi:MAG: poly-beta-hydroxybutyrate polymerase N-terminal domain-containing protein, partial [Cupriavidus necator]
MDETVTHPPAVPCSDGFAAGVSAGSDCAREYPGAALDKPATPIDRLLHAAIARATGGVSPAALWLAWLDWAWHLAGSPGKQMALCHR